MALLGPTRLFIFGKSCHLHCFLLSKYQKIPTYMPLLGPTRLFILGKSCHIHGFLLSKYQKNPTYMPLLGPTRLSTSYLHCYKGPTLIRNFRVHSAVHGFLPQQSLNLNFYKMIVSRTW